MSQRLIGVSISEAIDWTQDKLRSTRPQAETVLFEMIAEKKVTETEHGFLLLEVDDEEIARRGRKPNRRVSARFRFHAKRAQAHHRQGEHHSHAHSHTSVVQKGGSNDSSTLDGTDDDEIL